MKKKYIYYLLSFICPILGLFIITSLANFIPLGKYTFNVFDAFYQYGPILAEYLDKLRAGETIFYTLHGGMGVNFLSIINVYAGSFLNLLGIFFKRDNIYIFFTILIYVKLGLSGLFMYCYLNHLDTKYKGTVWNLIFSLIYALSGYITIYMMHIMWMDAYYLLPLIILGLDNLIKEGKPTLYVLVFSLAIMESYYMAFMISIFLVIYFLYYTLINKKFNGQVIKRFIGYSFLAALISMVVLLPAGISLLGGRFANFQVSNLFGIQDFTLFSLPYNFTIGSFIINDNYNYGSNNIFCTLFVLALVIYFFFNKKVEKREKIVTFIVILFFLLSFTFNLIDFAWNMLQAPVWWSHRYQFLFCFFLILIAYKSFCNLGEINLGKGKPLIVIVFMLLVVGSLSYKLKGLKLEDTYIYLMVLSLVLFFIYIFFMKPRYIFMALVLLEIGLNTYHNVSINRGEVYQEIKDSYKEKKELLDKVRDKDKWRSAIVYDGYEDEGLLYGFNSVELFSSSYNTKSLNFIDKLNISNKDINHQKLFIYNPAVLSLIGVKYLFGESNYYKCQDMICINEGVLPIGYEIPKSFLNLHLEDSYIKNINNIYSSLYGKEVSLFTKLSDDDIKLEDMKYSKDKGFYDIGKKAKIEFKYQAKKREMVVFNDLNVVSFGRAKVMINKEEIKVIDKKTDDLIILNPYDTIEITYDYDERLVYKYDDYLFSLMDLGEYEKIIQEIKPKTNWQTITDDKKGVLKGSIKTSEGYVMLSIPYDEGLTIKVDGKKVDYKQALDTFVAFKVNKGEHEILVDYRPKGLVLGGCISCVSLIVFLGIIKEKRKNS